MSDAFLSSIKNRRTIYALDKQLPVSQEKIVELVKEAVSHSPSAFNSQSSRVVVLFGAEHEQFWNIAKDELKKIVPADAFAATETKLNSFAAGAGTVLFFEDQTVVRQLQEQFALYADNFPVWSEQASGMAQFAVWTALAEHKVGASLQHYNPLVDAQTHKTWNLPESWKLRAQMPSAPSPLRRGESLHRRKRTLQGLRQLIGRDRRRKAPPRRGAFLSPAPQPRRTAGLGRRTLQPCCMPAAASRMAATPSHWARLRRCSKTSQSTRIAATG